MWKPIVSVSNISVRRGSKMLLENVNWQVEEKEHCGILGLNGSGKTTLLKIVTGYMWGTTGEVDVLGHRYGRVNIPELRKSIGWVSQALDQQFNHHSAETALDIVLSGKYASIGIYDSLTEADIKKAEELLQRFRIEHLRDAPLHTFSQGERKKAFLARAWMSDLKLLILDEPCSGLDLYSREEFLNTLQELMKEKDAPTLLFVTHHIEEMIPALKKVLLLREGKVVDSGDKSQVINEENIKKAFNVPVRLSWEKDRPWIIVK